MSHRPDKVMVEAQSDNLKNRFSSVDRAKEILETLDKAISSIGMEGEYNISYFEKLDEYSLIAEFREKSIIGRQRNE